MYRTFYIISAVHVEPFYFTYHLHNQINICKLYMVVININNLQIEVKEKINIK